MSKLGKQLVAVVRLAVVIFMIACPSFGAKAGTENGDTAIVSAQVQSSLDFRLNLTDIDKDYHDNYARLDKVLAGIDSILLNPGMEVKCITVVGSASPEGPYENNVRLATGRADVLIRILKSRYTFPDSIYDISVIPEDWEGLRLMLVENPTIPYSKATLEFLDETEQLAPATRESRLKRLDRGRPYASMRDNVLPFLRRVSVLVDYETEWLRRGTLIELPVAQTPTPDIAIPQTPLPEILPIAVAPVPKERFFAIKTNLLWDLALCANLGMEVELWPHWSLDVPVWYSPYDITERWRIRLLATQPELRYWLKDAGEGHYFGVHATVAGFNVSLNGDYRYQDPNHAAYGAGIGYGYAFHLDKSRRWSMEAQIGVGCLDYKWIKYRNTGRNGAELSRGKSTYWGVTRVGLTISYKFYRERKGRRWMRW